MVQSLSLFWPLIALAVLGIVAFLMMMESGRAAKDGEGSSRLRRFIRRDRPASAVVRPQPQRQPLS